MRVVIQRSKYSNVKVDSKIVGQIDNGLVILVLFRERHPYILMKQILYHFPEEESMCENIFILSSQMSS